MVPALLVKNYPIRLLKKFWHILLVLCTWYISCSIQLEAHEDNWNINVWKRTEAGAGVWAMKKRELRSRNHTHENQELQSWSRVHEKKSSGPELWHFYDGSAALK